MTNDVVWQDDEPEPRPASEPIALLLPKGFHLPTLLTFVPDVKLKQRLVDTVDAALKIDVTQDGALEQLDVIVPDISRQIESILFCFDGTEQDQGPTRLAGSLHKRLTGLRSDFISVGQSGLKTLRDRIAGEVRRRERIREEARRLAQEKADREMRKAAREAVQQAKEDGAPKDVVTAMRQQAKVATAPPVTPPIPEPTLTNLSTRDKWRCRFKGTPDGADPHPDVADMTPPQQQQLRTVLRAIADGELPIMVSAGLDWSYLDKRAGADKTTFAMLELEAVNEGGLNISKK